MPVPFLSQAADWKYVWQNRNGTWSCPKELTIGFYQNWLVRLDGQRFALTVAHILRLDVSARVNLGKYQKPLRN
jgi:hypothetical protein